MHTITIELERQGASNALALSAQTVYLALCQQQPPVNICIQCNQETFEQYREKLRYNESDKKDKETAFQTLQKLITDVLDNIRYLPALANNNPADWLHIRLVISAKELVQLPFEVALTPFGFQGHNTIPFFLNPNRLTTVTREVKQVNKADYEWPVRPRILYVAASPNEPVPFQEHFDALSNVIMYLTDPIKNNPEPVADIGSLITPIRYASLKIISETIKQAIDEGKPYTHIHMLAHGSKKVNNNDPLAFTLVLHHNDDINKAYYASGDELARAILQIDGNSAKLPAVLSLMACDSANAGNITLPAGSLAHQLHEAGIPCVLASQFPLSVSGSVKLVEELYNKLLLQGEDPRKVLYFTRQAIADRDLHDWASLVAYIRFPNNIDEQLKDYRLKVLLQLLKVTNNTAEHVLRYKDQLPESKTTAVFDHITKRLEKAINDLISLFKRENGKVINKDRYAEHSGLLGSAYKRMAEHVFRLALVTADTNELRSKRQESLKSSKDWYLNGFRKNPASHWTGIQYLSLTAVITGTLQSELHQDYWTVIKVMAIQYAEQDKVIMDKIWAWGTLMELYLLKPLTAEESVRKPILTQSLEKAKEYAAQIANATAVYIDADLNTKQDIQFAIETTARQLDRYIQWWPADYAGAAMELLKEMATEIRKWL
jgi:hypothetical protein